MKVPNTSYSASRGRRVAEHGSAYIVTLLLLFILTGLGLSLSLITSTEAQMGSQERTIQRTFYSADSGLGLAVAATMSRNQCQSRCITLQDDSPDLFNANGLVDRVELSKMASLGDQASNLTQINDTQFRSINHYVAARGLRMASDTNSDIPIGVTTVGQMFALDPWVSPMGCFTDYFVPCTDSSSLVTLPPPG